MAITAGIGGEGRHVAGNAFVTMGLGGVFTAGSCVLVGVVSKNTSLTVTGFSDDTDGSDMVFAQIGGYITPTGLRISLWATAIDGGHSGGSFVNALLSSDQVDTACVLQEFTGVAAIGINGNTNNTNANPTIALTTQDNDNVVLTIVGAIGATEPTSLTGTLRNVIASNEGTEVAAAHVSNTATSPSSVTTAVTLAAATWAAIALEVRSTGGAASPSRGLTLMGIG